MSITRQKLVETADYLATLLKNDGVAPVEVVNNEQDGDYPEIYFPAANGTDIALIVTPLV